MTDANTGGKGFSKNAGTGGLMTFETTSWGGYCGSKDEKCAKDKIATYFGYTFKDDSSYTTRSVAPNLSTFAVTKFMANPKVMTALRGRGEYSGGTWNAAGSLLNDFFVTLTTKVADY